MFCATQNLYLKSKSTYSSQNHKDFYIHRHWSVKLKHRFHVTACSPYPVRSRRRHLRASISGISRTLNILSLINSWPTTLFCLFIQWIFKGTMCLLLRSRGVGAKMRRKIPGEGQMQAEENEKTDESVNRITVQKPCSNTVTSAINKKLCLIRNYYSIILYV